jgi:anthranilate synthase/aminodeoxychorismate synthase-like glutamine amidotransferase
MAGEGKMHRVIFLDNFDSFTFILVHYLQILGASVEVIRSNAITSADILALNPSSVILGPGPGIPADAGITIECIRTLAGKIPLLGICLGHQAIAEAFGGIVRRADRLMHGKQSQLFHDGKVLFQQIPQGFSATRYHSLIVENTSLPECLEVTAWTSSGEIMGLRHKNAFIEGIQFHPESIMSEYGLDLLKNFLSCKNTPSA